MSTATPPRADAHFQRHPEFLTSPQRFAKSDVSPVIVIGMPRSGSTFLTHVLNCLDGLFVFDDLYCLQKAESLRCSGPLNPTQLSRLLDFLGWQTRARIRHGQRFERWPMTWSDVDQLRATLDKVLADAPVTWPEVMNEYLTRLAGFLGRKRWGYKTPQDFHHIETLHHHFPHAQFLFVMRDPREMMASYKFNRTQDGHPGQYHPVAYARYWRMAVTDATAACNRLDIPQYVVRLEDLRNEPDRVAHDVARYLNTRLAHPISRSRPNSSFAHTRRRISATETWLCEHICGDLMCCYGYGTTHPHPRLFDTIDLAAVTLRFLSHQTQRLIEDPVARVKIKDYCRRCIRRPHFPQTANRNTLTAHPM